MPMRVYWQLNTYDKFKIDIEMNFMVTFWCNNFWLKFELCMLVIEVIFYVSYHGNGVNVYHTVEYCNTTIEKNSE